MNLANNPPPILSNSEVLSLRNVADENGLTLNWWVKLIKRVHPDIGRSFESGALMYEQGFRKPCNSYSEYITARERLLRIGWDMANRARRNLSEANKEQEIEIE